MLARTQEGVRQPKSHAVPIYMQIMGLCTAKVSQTLVRLTKKFPGNNSQVRIYS